MKRNCLATLVLAAIVLTANILAKTERHRYMNPQTSRVIHYSQPRAAPFSFASIKVAGNTVEPNIPFSAADDWLSLLELRVKNISDKPISFIAISALVSSGVSADGTPEVTEARIFMFGKRPGNAGAIINTRIQPNEEASLTASPCTDCPNVLASEVRFDIAAVFWNDDPEYMFRHNRLLRRTGENTYEPVSQQIPIGSTNSKRKTQIWFKRQHSHLLRHERNALLTGTA